MSLLQAPNDAYRMKQWILRGNSRSESIFRLTAVFNVLDQSIYFEVFQGITMENVDFNQILSDGPWIAVIARS